MLIRQFLLESLLLNLLAGGLAALILFFVTPFFNQLLGEPLSFNWHEQYRYWLSFAAIFAGGTLLSGFYPAMYLSFLQPIQALRGKLSYQGKNYLRPTLVVVQRTSFDHDFVPTYGVALLAGRNFSEKFEGAVVLINETASEALGFASPEAAIDQELDDGWYVRRIVGVISDYYQRSPKFKIEPLVISPFSKEQGYITLTVQQKNVSETLAHVEAVYQTLFPGNAFEYFFLDEYFARQFVSDRQFSQVLTVFSGLALFIAALGLLGFTAYLSNSRTKEIGIRKVVGAGGWDIVILFNQDMVKLVLVASAIALPMAYFTAQVWLANYASRININLSYLLLPSGVLLLITLTVTTLQLLKIVRTDAVDLLRHE